MRKSINLFFINLYMKKIYARQGDVDIFKIKSLPRNLKLRKGTTLALGEVTGHHHTLVPEDIKTQINVYLDDIAKKTYFEVINGNAKLTHQEHKTKPQIFIPGVYEVNIEQEYDYFSETIRAVKD